jgi:hypothetical protein
MISLLARALELLREDAAHLADAKAHAHAGNSIVGELLAQERPEAPRWAVGRAVLNALALLGGEERER